MSRPGSMSYTELCEYEVEWYRMHGKYPTRIKIKVDGLKYVEGDWSWNNAHSNAIEVIGDRMAEHVARKITGLSA